MHSVRKNDIIHTSEILNEISKVIENYRDEKILILTDQNCKKYCLPQLHQIFGDNSYVLSLKPGEKNKNISNLTKIWNFLFENNFSKKSLVLNIGGGVITDIGGFAATTYKRGIDYVNIPTSLLAQVDASAGGKNGINYQGIKNSIGAIHLPKKVIIYSGFLKTLQRREFLSGFAEMIKHALIFEKVHYDDLMFYIKSRHPDYKMILPLIRKSIQIKQSYTVKDIYEKGPRKILNFGHTFGHAFEAYFNLGKKSIQKLKHGEAVAFGIICELFLSMKRLNFPESVFKIQVQDIHQLYGNLYIEETEFRQIFELMKKDKKNTNFSILCVLLENIGVPVYDISVSELEVYDSLKFLISNNNNA